MALGFRDCCNEFNYFLLTETPASVSEFEVYYIETNEGPTFCATYINLPPLNYTPTTYNVTNLIQQVDCATCILTNPCPTEQNILENQFGPGSAIIQSDCNFTSIRYLDVECFPVNPTYQNSLDGQVVLFATGGVPPYLFRDFNTNQVLQANPVIDNFYTVLTNVPAGDYRFLVSDTDENFIIDITCTLTAPPPFPVFSAQTIDATVYGKPDGQIDLIVLSAGTPPYGYIINGIVYDTLPITVGAGTYTITIFDQFYTTEVTAIVNEPPPVDYPQLLCFNTTVTTAPGCTQIFGLTFTRFVNDYDYRAQYYADNPEIIGFTELNIRYEVSSGGWVIVPSKWNGGAQFSSPCLVSILSPGDIGFIKLDGTTDTPDGEWFTDSIVYFTSTSVASGACVPTLTLRGTTDYCSVTPVTFGTVSLEAAGGTGQPYKFVVIPDSNLGGAITSPNPIVGSLQSGNYTAYVLDNTGTQSGVISFTINSTTPYILNLANINQCLTYTQNSVFLNVVPASAGGGVNRIDPGESRRTRVTTSTNFNFSFLPTGFEVTTRITISMDFTATVSVTPYTDPRTYFINNINSSPITTSTITTDGVTSDFMNGVNYVTSTYPNPLLGDGWYRIANGSVSCATGTGNCPAPLDVNGARYRKTVTWTSNLLTINNTTSISLSYFNEFINSIPIIIGTTTGCYNGCGGGQIFSTLNASMLTPTKTKGCGSVTGTSRRLMYYIYSQHPNNGASLVNNIPPAPLCP